MINQYSGKFNTDMIILENTVSLGLLYFKRYGKHTVLLKHAFFN